MAERSLPAIRLRNVLSARGKRSIRSSVHAGMEVPEACLQFLGIMHPCHSIDAGRCGLLQTEEPRSKDIKGDMIEKCCEPFRFILVKASRMRACARDTASRLCVRTVFCRSTFSLVPPLRSTDSFAASAAPFARFPATMGRSDFSRPFIVGYGLRPTDSLE